jgi:acyl-CoA hydrolase
MEVGVKVLVEDLYTGEVRHTNSCYLTFVALSEDGKPREIAPAIAETAEEIRRFQEAGERRAARLVQRDKTRQRFAAEGR